MVYLACPEHFASADLAFSYLPCFVDESLAFQFALGDRRFLFLHLRLVVAFPGLVSILSLLDFLLALLDGGSPAADLEIFVAGLTLVDHFGGRGVLAESEGEHVVEVLELRLREAGVTTLLVLELGGVHVEVGVTGWVVARFPLLLNFL